MRRFDEDEDEEGNLTPHRQRVEDAKRLLAITEEEERAHRRRLNNDEITSSSSTSSDAPRNRFLEYQAPGAPRLAPLKPLIQGMSMPSMKEAIELVRALYLMFSPWLLRLFFTRAFPFFPPLFFWLF